MVSGQPCVRPTDHPFTRESVRPTVRPVLLRRKTNIVLTATTSTLFIATTKETTKEVPRPKAAPPLLWWRPTAATFVVAMNRVDVVALNTIFVLRLSKTGRTVGRTDSRLDGWSVGRTDNWHCCEGLTVACTHFKSKENRILKPSIPDSWLWALKALLFEGYEFGDYPQTATRESPI